MATAVEMPAPEAKNYLWEDAVRYWTEHVKAHEEEVHGARVLTAPTRAPLRLLGGPATSVNRPQFDRSMGRQDGERQALQFLETEPSCGPSCRLGGRRTPYGIERN